MNLLILLDQDTKIYNLADVIEIKIQTNFEWPVNKAYETKEKKQGTILISNKNNVKGLEFPFVICITRKIRNSPSYRNSLYTMLTRSFIKSFLLIPPMNSGLTEGMKNGLDEIVASNQMIIQEPSEEEKEKIRTRFRYSLKTLSHYDLMMKIYQDLKIEKIFHESLLKASQEMDMIGSDEEILIEFVKDNYKYLKDK